MGRVNKRKKRVQAKGEYIGKINIFCAKIDDKYRGLPKNRKKSETENQPKITEPPKINQKKNREGSIAIDMTMKSFSSEQLMNRMENKNYRDQGIQFLVYTVFSISHLNSYYCFELDTQNLLCMLLQLFVCIVVYNFEKKEILFVEENVKIC